MERLRQICNTYELQRKEIQKIQIQLLIDTKKQTKEQMYTMYF